jgi:hypothetical protein
LNREVRSPIAGLLPGMYGVAPAVGLGRLSRLVLESGFRLQLYSMNLISAAWSAYVWSTYPGFAYFDTTINGMRGPSPKKSIGWI